MKRTMFLMKLMMLFGSLITISDALDNGLALTPPMGWLSWERFRCNIDCQNDPENCISENLYMAMADRLVADGYRDLGYVYVNIDDCWAEMERDNVTKQMVADKNRFPHGIKWLADYMHQRGLKLGIYSAIGPTTCAHYPASQGYFDIDAKTFAEWQVDSVKFDGCNYDPHQMKTGYPEFGQSLNKTGHPMLYSCEWPLYEWVYNITSDYTAIAATCNIFRNYYDVDDSFDSVKVIIDHYQENRRNFLAAAGPGHFLDPDMLIVGDFGLSYDQQRLQLGMWAMFAAPLHISNDLRTIRPDSAALLKNPLLIAIDHDPLGIAGVMAFDNKNDVKFWTRVLKGGRCAVAAVNYGILGTPTSISKSLAELNVTAPASSQFTVTDVFEQSQVGMFHLNDPVLYYINPSGIVMLLFTPQS